MNRLKELRQEKGLTQQALANEIGVFYRTIQNWENGKSQIKPEKAQQLADYFGVSVGYLLGYSDEQYTPERIKREIQKRLARKQEPLDEKVLSDTLGVIEQASFLGLDLDTMVSIYFYHLNTNPLPSLTLEDLPDFFDSEVDELFQMLSGSWGRETDKFLADIDKMGDYKKLLSEYLTQRHEKAIPKMVDDFNKDFIEFLKRHDLYLSDQQIPSIINTIYSMSNVNDSYLMTFIRNNDLEGLQLEKQRTFSQLFEYSSFWRMQEQGLEFKTKSTPDN